MDRNQTRQYRRSVKLANSDVFAAAERRDIEELLVQLDSPLETENISVRFSALMHLGKLGAPEAIPHIVSLLSDQDHTIRAGAIVALTRLNAREAGNVITAMLNDPHPGVRQRAAEGLAILGDRSSSSRALIQALRDDVWHVRREALNSLAALGASDAIPAIEKARESESVWRRRHVDKVLGTLRH